MYSKGRTRCRGNPGGAAQSRENSPGARALITQSSTHWIRMYACIYAPYGPSMGNPSLMTPLEVTRRAAICASPRMITILPVTVPKTRKWSAYMHTKCPLFLDDDLPPDTIMQGYCYHTISTPWTAIKPDYRSRVHTRSEMALLDFLIPGYTRVKATLRTGREEGRDERWKFARS